MASFRGRFTVPGKLFTRFQQAAFDIGVNERGGLVPPQLYNLQSSPTPQQHRRRSSLSTAHGGSNISTSLGLDNIQSASPQASHTPFVAIASAVIGVALHRFLFHQSSSGVVRALIIAGKSHQSTSTCHSWTTRILQCLFLTPKIPST